MLKTIRELYTVYLAREWLMPIVEKRASDFSLRRKSGECGSSDSRLYYNGDFPNDLKESWEITLTKWYLLFWNYAGAWDGGIKTCGLCMDYFYADVCLNCPIAEAGYNHCKNSPYITYCSTSSRRSALSELAFLIDLYESTCGLGADA